MIDGDIDGIIFKGDERTAEMRRNYEGMNFEDLRLQQLQVGTNCLAMGGRGFPEGSEHVDVGLARMLTVIWKRKQKKKGTFFLEPAK